MMQKVLLFLISVGVGLGIVFAYFELISFPQINIQISNVTNHFKSTLFSLTKAPSQSLVGNIKMLSGDVEFTSRIATESAKIFSPEIVQQGEKLATGIDGNVSIQFDNVAEIVLEPNSEVYFVQTLPSDIVMLQQKGSITYKKLSDIPVSIRSLHLLVENKGQVKVTVDSVRPLLSVNVFDGDITIAYNNIYNISRVLDIPKGRIVTFNDAVRRVTIKQS